MVPDTITGTAWCYGDNIDTDQIYPGEYLAITEPEGMAKFALAGLDSKFGKKVQVGDIIVSGSNFGSGSSREQAAMSLKYAGISAIVAVSFARIFYRNIINQGVPALISFEAINIIKTGDVIELDIHSGRLKNLTKKKACKLEPIPAFLMEIITAGGKIPFLKKKIKDKMKKK
jgi:3-isopropylmalate/(R)-2-methylmalate dehydratase small subunit